MIILMLRILQAKCSFEQASYYVEWRQLSSTLLS